MSDPVRDLIKKTFDHASEWERTGFWFNEDDNTCHIYFAIKDGILTEKIKKIDIYSSNYTLPLKSTIVSERKTINKIRTLPYGHICDINIGGLELGMMIQFHKDWEV